MFPDLTQENHMSALRKQMEADMVLRGLAFRTRKSYIEAVVSFSKYFGRSPAQITQVECQNYLLYLLEERKLAHSSCNVVASALQFLYLFEANHGQLDVISPGGGRMSFTSCLADNCNVGLALN
jgi:site-specific recombinase XerD